MKKYLMILIVSLLTTAAMAQVNKVPADTRLYLQMLDNGNKQACARSANGMVKPEGVTFRMNGGQLLIDGAENGTPIRIYTTDGRLVVSTVLTDGSVSLPATSPAGVYAVQVGTLGSTLIRK